jgi:hypothetical protein
MLLERTRFLTAISVSIKEGLQVQQLLRLSLMIDFNLLPLMEPLLAQRKLSLLELLPLLDTNQKITYV